MTPQEALELLNDVEFSEKYQGKQEYADMLLLCKNALEKQILKKPKGVTDPIFGDVTTVCPSCNNANLANPFVRNRVYDYCPNCGQALDWGD